MKPGLRSWWALRPASRQIVVNAVVPRLRAAGYDEAASALESGDGYVDLTALGGVVVWGEKQLAIPRAA